VRTSWNSCGWSLAGCRPASLAGNHLPGSDLRTEFENYLRQRFELPASRAAPSARAMLEQLRERNFILALFGAGVYGFVHRAFLEYLAAADISDRFAAHDISADDLSRVFSDHWAAPAWHEVLVLITGMIPSRFAGTIIAGLLKADPVWRLRTQTPPTHLLLAIRCLAEVRKPGEIARQARAVAARAVLLLSTWGADEYLGLTSADPLSDFTSAAVPALARLGPYWAGRHLYEDWYLTCGQFIPRRYAGNGVSYAAARMYLALLGQDPQTSHAVIRNQADHGAASDFRRAAVEALAAGWREDPGTLPLLRDRATTDRDADVRQAAVEALAGGWREDPGTLPLLRDLATTDQNEGVPHSHLTERP
jgi:HEAT repeats